MSSTFSERLEEESGKTNIEGGMEQSHPDQTEQRTNDRNSSQNAETKNNFCFRGSRYLSDSVSLYGCIHLVKLRCGKKQSFRRYE